MYKSMMRMAPRRPILQSQLAAQRNPGPVVDWRTFEWMPATFFDGPPSPTARRWIKLLSPVAGPGIPPGGGLPGSPALPPGGVPIPYYNAILFTQSGAQQRNVTVMLNRIQLPGGGSRIEAAIVPINGFGSSSSARRLRSSGATRNANPPRHSGVYRALTASDRNYLTNRVEHMRNVFFTFAEQSSGILNPDQIGFIAAMAATGLLGDDGGTPQHERKFMQALEFASNWLETHQVGPIPFG